MRLTKIFAAAFMVILALTGCSFNIPQRPEAVSKTINTDFAAQIINWQRCGAFECAQIEAPLDWEAPANGQAIKLNLARIPAKTQTPKGTIFINPGGPGASGTEYLKSADNSLKALLENYHVASWDPRGVNNSSAVSCLTDKETDAEIYGNEQNSQPGTEQWLAEIKSYNEALALKCEERSGKLYQYVSTANTVADLNLLRQLVGDQKLNYLGFSYGTYIGARYADKYPELVGNMVLDGAMDPTANTAEVVLNQTKGFEQALHNYMTACVARNNCWHQGSVETGMQRIRQLLDNVAASPLQASDGRWVTSSVLVTALVTPLYSADFWEHLDVLFTEISEGKTERALLLADFYYNRDTASGKYNNNSRIAFTAINCADYVQAKPNLEEMRKEAAELAAAAPILGKFQGFGGAGCWGWPLSAASRDGVTAAGAAPIVVVGTTGDPATPYQWAKNLASQLESGRLVTYEGEGHIAFGKSDCVTNIIYKYFNAEALPQPETICSF